MNTIHITLISIFACAWLLSLALTICELKNKSRLATLSVVEL